MSNVYIDDTASVDDGASVEKGTKIWRNCQVREGAKIGGDCTLSKGVYVGKNVEVGDGCKIQNGVSIFEGVVLEEEVFCGPHMTFTNDKNIRINPDEYTPIPTYVKRSASMGAHATVLPDLTIGEYALVGAQSLVSKDVPAFALVYGNPARIRGVVCYCGRKLSDVGGIRRGDRFECAECGEVVEINETDFAERLES
ncbi:acetyltransferase-like isoleucine patch superfamily enzyme [Salinibacter ruber]|uniref:acyltransferase n=1 Tax=Salinibacter ruber TaxID=146919 RepID=UPI0021675C66|nr:acyltransferase [Salinibacter ruber]MCS3856501.1 acetyltransferase-like isoleucine patch superfamily enzyme [Salinibacter ruber]